MVSTLADFLQFFSKSQLGPQKSLLQSQDPRGCPVQIVALKKKQIQHFLMTRPLQLGQAARQEQTKQNRAVSTDLSRRNLARKSTRTVFQRGRLTILHKVSLKGQEQVQRRNYPKMFPHLAMLKLLLQNKRMAPSIW